MALSVALAKTLAALAAAAGFALSAAGAAALAGTTRVAVIAEAEVGEVVTVFTDGPAALPRKSVRSLFVRGCEARLA